MQEVRFTLTPDKMTAFDDNSIVQVRVQREIVTVGGKQPPKKAIKKALKNNSGTWRYIFCGRE